MTDSPQPVRPTLASPTDQMFPRLTPAQIDRIAVHGRMRSIERGEVLVTAGDRVVPFFVVAQGQVEIVRPGSAGETLITIHGPGEFTGEVNMLSGRRSIVTARARESGRLIEMDRACLLSLVQTDSELSEILMRAFIFRRVELIAHGLGDVVLIGSSHCAATLGIKEFLTRNSHPYTYLDLDRDNDVQAMLDQFQVSDQEIPVLISGGTTVLRNPTTEQIAESLGLNDPIDQAAVHDVVIIGSGPSGLAAAVYGASEGLKVLVLESRVPGGQAGSSSKIENYLGFPTGVSGYELTARAYNQAQKFGARMLVARGATGLTCDRNPYVVQAGIDTRLLARSVVIATGADYRKPALENLTRFEGAGVYYGATFMEAQLCMGEEVIVVGGGNSAGQAAVFLAMNTKRVHLIVRSDGLAGSMSRYLVRRIEDNPVITLRTHTELVMLDGDTHLEQIRWRNNQTGEQETHDIRHVFFMTGAVPSTGWLRDCLALDEKGFIKTGPTLSDEDLANARWPLARAPHLLETSRPGVFAVGDVRSGSVKRVASAVGEGSIAIAFLHQFLAE
jgi:thioredoxin reductase (NADPH)